MEYFFVLAYGVVGSVKYMMHLLTQRLCGKASLLENYFELPPGKEYFFDECYADKCKIQS